MNLFWLIILFIHPLISSARILDHYQWPFHHMTTHRHPITFFMHNSLKIDTAASANHYSSSRPITTRSSPSSLSASSSSSSSTVLQTDHQTLDTSSIGWIMSFPAGAIATLQGLTLGTVTAIDEMLMAGHPLPNGFSQLIGKAQGVCVSPSDEDHGSTNGHVMMMAMNLLFANGDFKNGLKLFGVVNLQQPDLHHHHEESHIAVIGGTGKYVGANGYATVKAVTGNMDEKEGHEIDSTIKNFLQFTIYLS